MSELPQQKQRAIICCKDVERFTGLSGRTARRMLNKVRKANGKKAYSWVAVREFCAYYNIDEPVFRKYVV